MSSTPAPRANDRALVVTSSLMLFSMFFGAGNLIFPPVVGAQAGSSLAPAMVGFALGGVALPVVAVVAIAFSGSDVRATASRAGVVFGTVFAAVVYLSIGAFYALPRTGAVSYSMAVTPLTGLDGTWSRTMFNGVFFLISAAVAVRPRTIVATLGRFLTPALLALLALLVGVTLLDGPVEPGAPVAGYATAPLPTGLFQGYMTMDSVAALAFSIVVIAGLREHGVRGKVRLARATAASATIAGVLLLVVYVGLALVGAKVGGDGDGTSLLTTAAEHSLGRPGLVVFAVVVLLACLTTSIGLLTACSSFFALLVPGLGYRGWLAIFTVLSFTLASSGLDSVLAFAEPIILTIYPVCITVVALTLLSALLDRHRPMYWAFRLPAWTTAVFSLLELAVRLGLLPAGLLGSVPLVDTGFGWVVPTLVALLVGVVLDARRPRSAPATER